MKISELQMDTHRLEEMYAFYAKALGFDVLDAGTDSFTVQTGFTRLTFQRTDSDDKPFYHYAFNVPSNLLSDSMRWLAEKGVEFLTDDGESLIDQGAFWNAHSCYFHDPAGNIAEFIGRHSLADSNSVAFSVAEVVGVSEIGLPVVNPEKVVGELEQTLGLGTLHSGGYPNFVGMGSDEGLLIVVDYKRPWFPTNETPVQSSICGNLDTGTQGVWQYQDGLYRLESF